MAHGTHTRTGREKRNQSPNPKDFTRLKEGMKMETDQCNKEGIKIQQCDVTHTGFAITETAKGRYALEDAVGADVPKKQNANPGHWPTMLQSGVRPLDSQGRPRNPMGRTGLRGRGHFFKWGPNYCGVCGALVPLLHTHGGGELCEQNRFQPSRYPITG